MTPSTRAGASPPPATRHAFTVDVEDWHQLLRRRVTGETPSPSGHVVPATHRILDLLDEASVRGTFFVMGRVADAFPDLVREIARRGHEIGSHTYDHQLVWGMEPSAFRRDVDRSRAQLQDLTGQPVLGFRAPEFSVRALGHWSFGVLAEAGFRYDSSVFPIPGARYGIPEAGLRPFAVETPQGPIWEFPLATWQAGARRVPIAGGSYYRLLPDAILRRALGALDAAGQPAVLYFHPYEFHRGRLRLDGLTAAQRRHPAYVRFGLLHNFRTGAVARRVRSLLSHFRFVPLGELYQQYAHPSRPAAPPLPHAPV